MYDLKTVTSCHTFCHTYVVDDKKLFESMELVRRVAQRIVFSHDADVVTGLREGFYRVP